VYTKKSDFILAKPGLIPYADGNICFTLKLSSRRRSLVIQINDKAQIIVYAPLLMREEDIYRFLRVKINWINRKIAQIKSQISFKDKDSENYLKEVLFLGKKYEVKINHDKLKRCKVLLSDDKINVTVPPPEQEITQENNIKSAIEKWYKFQAKEIIPARIFHFSRIIGVVPKEIAIKTQKRLWGNCNYRTKKININWQIILAPIDVIDYVVVHELYHLLLPNHSLRFWQNVQKIIPGYKNTKKWLRDNQSALSFV